MKTLQLAGLKAGLKSDLCAELAARLAKQSDGWPDVKAEVKDEEQDEVQNVEAASEVKRAKRVRAPREELPLLAATAPQPKRRAGRAARDDTGWEGWLAKLRRFKAEHSDCSVPLRWVEDPRLGSWVSNQRTGKKKLDRSETSGGMTAARVAKLTALGFACELRRASAEVLVPRAGDPGDPSARITAARAAKLKAPGFGGEAGASEEDTGWEGWLAKLRQYRTEHGDCRVPRGCAEDPGLGSWVSNQRKGKQKLERGKLCGGMAAVQAAKLDAPGFAWEVGAWTHDAGWETQRLVRTRKNGTPKDVVCPYCATCDKDHGADSGDENESQPQIKTRQRRKTKKDRTVHRFGKWWRGIGYSGDFYCQRCSEVFRDHLIRQKSNSANCSRLSPCDDCAKLLVFFPPDIWVQVENQAEQKNKRKLGRTPLAAGVQAVTWPRGDDTRWEDWLANLMRYKAVHGDCNVPQRWAEDPGLGSWASKQRLLKKKLDRGEPCRGMTVERAAKLTAVGFVWQWAAKPVAGSGATRDGAIWEGWLAEPMQYKAEHGDFNVPTRWAEDARLNSW
jgi:hypothetical protein